MDRLGVDVGAEIDWSQPRLLCIAGDFTRYDQHAVQQINRSIELIRYRRFGDDLLLLELVNAAVATTSGEPGTASGLPKAGVSAKSASQVLADADPQVRDIFEALRAFLLSLGDDVQLKVLRQYFAFKRLKNFASVDVSSKKLKIYVKVPPAEVHLQEGFTRDVSQMGHWGTGDLEITVADANQLEQAKPLLLQSYERS
jgi:predicted transport protein